MSDGVALRKTSKTFYRALLDTRFDRAFSFGKLLQHMCPAYRAPEFRNGAASVPLGLRKQDSPALFRRDLQSLYLDNHPQPLPEGVFYGALNLKWLNLDGHPHALPEGLFARATNLKTLYLNDHPHALPEGLIEGLRARGVKVTL